jgi:hypothetical protein
MSEQVPKATLVSPQEVVDFLSEERVKRFAETGNDREIVRDWNAMLDVIDYLKARYGCE